jgi:SAM-dependent methyltransferase
VPGLETCPIRHVPRENQEGHEDSWLPKRVWSRSGTTIRMDDLLRPADLVSESSWSVGADRRSALTTDRDDHRAHGGLVYDHETVFSNYAAHRRWPANPNRVMEEPALLDVLGDVRGARVLDLGCGDAALGRVLLDAGCASYTGMDSSWRMVEQARETLKGTSGEVTLGAIEDVQVLPDSVDLVVSRLALHYVEHIDPILHTVHDSLTESGRLVFTVTHPVVTCHDASTVGEKRTNWIVDEYFVSGARSREWMGGHAVWYHRTIEDYVCAVQRAGFRLTRLSECPPDEKLLAGEPEEYQRRLRVPLILLIAGEKT